MAISKTSAVVLSDQVDKKQVKYLNKDYSEFKKNLVDFAKFYFPDTYQDFSDASPGSIFIDMASYIGDVLSYYTDNSFKESLLAYAEERENIVAIAQGLGFKPRLTSPSFCKVALSALVPADSEGNLDTRFLPRIAAGSSFGATTQFDAGTFLTEDICDFGDSNNRTVQIFSLDGGTNLPSTYIVTKICKVVSATTKTLEYTVGSPTKFLKIAMTEDNIVEVESVVDSEGNTWYEVDNLSQDYRFEDVLKSVRGSTTAPLYTIKPVKVNRRFITRLNRNNKIELVFGSGTGDLSDVYENPDYKSVYDQQYLQNMTNVSLDTLNFTNSNSFGLAPGNTTLTITYRVSNGLRSNVPSGTISKIVNINTLNETRTLSASDLATFNTMVSSITVINEEAATGGLNSPTTEQLRQSAIGFVNAQGRIVTSQDYEKRILSMPSKYGAIAKAFAMRDSAISDIDKFNNTEGVTSGIDDDIIYVDDDPVNNNINLYMLGYDSDRRLISLNNDVKLNVKKFLKGYRMMTDRINILDAFRVSIGVNYTIVTYRGFNSYEVLAKCSDAVAQYFNIDNWNINQPILIDDLLLTIARIEGVQSVTTIDVVNKWQQKHGRDYAPYRYDVSTEGGNRSNNIVYPSVDPCIFELRYPQNDIVGTALQ
jgi:hypothetical protein